ncbi:response regulator [Salmonirosea aquatica]|uniref:Response regulator n=1 Tax=Salmonirosea aquatica TaxID=2654236 RepID=A0A7C9F2Q6_9BACT|nr:response regulator [Cytophagaceae bacterium SJW1-29]
MTSSSASLTNIHNFKNITILLVEDNPDHLFLIRAALQECVPDIHLVETVDRKSALQYLASEWDKKGKNLPKLILLDLYLPTREEGLEALKGFKSFFAGRSQPSIPVVMFSFSDRVEDINDSYEFGANAYLVKSPDYEAWKKYFEGLRDFWLETVSLPMHEV